VALDQVLATRIGENDSLSAYVANLIDADLLVMLTDVAGLYEGDPRQNPDARLLDRVERIDSTIESLGGGAHTGTGGMATKLRAAQIATQAGVDVVITNGREAGTLLAVANGEQRGTYFPAPGDRIESRKRWILAHISREGHIVVDPGAVSALRGQGRSLLPAGIASVHGAFQRGDAVEIRDGLGNRVAAGTTNYASEELARIRGMHSDKISETLGYAYGDEVIHRDNMVIF